MYPDTIDPKTKRVFELLKTKLPDSCYLAGGTALAIELGHRKSIDLDFFSKNPLNIPKLKKELSHLGQYTLEYEDQKTLDGILDEVKVSFFHYDYDLLYPLVGFEGVGLADERDIAAMKMDAVSSRGSKKDFIDLYFLLKKYALPELLMFFENKFSALKYNKSHLLKSLVYFDDATHDPMPIMLKECSWEEVMRGIKEGARKLF